MTSALAPFRLIYSLEPQPLVPTMAEEEDETPFMRAMRCVKSSYFHSRVIVAGGSQRHELELAYDIAYVLFYIPAWLDKLAFDGDSPLAFPDQGSDQELCTTRRGDTICYVFRPLSEPADPRQQVCVLATEFLSQWWQLAHDVASLLLEASPEFAADDEYRSFHEALLAVRDRAHAPR